jgi:hypothetical protein
MPGLTKVDALDGYAVAGLSAGPVFGLGVGGGAAYGLRAGVVDVG